MTIEKVAKDLYLTLSGLSIWFKQDKLESKKSNNPDYLSDEAGKELSELFRGVKKYRPELETLLTDRFQIMQHKRKVQTGSVYQCRCDVLTIHITVLSYK